MYKKDEIKIYSRKCTYGEDDFSCSFLVFPDKKIIELKRCKDHLNKKQFRFGFFFQPIDVPNNYKIYKLDSNKIPFQIRIMVVNLLHDMGIV